MRRILIISLAITGLACATAYQPMGRSGGYAEKRIDDSTYEVEFRGNRSTSLSQVERYLLYRCAELTVASGYDYFIIDEAVDQTEIERRVEEGGSVRTTGNEIVRRNSSDSNEIGSSDMYVPPVEKTTSRPHVAVTITMAHGTRPADNPSAFDARTLMERVSVK